MGDDGGQVLESDPVSAELRLEKVGLNENHLPMIDIPTVPAAPAVSPVSANSQGEEMRLMFDSGDSPGPIVSTDLFDSGMPSDDADEEVKEYAKVMESAGQFNFFHSTKVVDGVIGLSNQGATCFLNSLLQTLFWTPEFRKALYSFRFDEKLDKPESCIPYQLQLLFARMHIGKLSPIDTRDLTTSFGWTAYEVFQQHDVQELNRLLFDVVCSALKEQGNGSVVDALYQGELEDGIECKECGIGTSRVDFFEDVQLVIQEQNNLSASLNHFVEKEVLEGDNQYFCSSCDKKVDAFKSLRFKKLPKILTIHLKRSGYDLKTHQRFKINTSLDFPLVLDMSPYLEGSGNYELFSICVHSGGATGGHYTVYLKLYEKESQWYHINDSSISKVEEERFERLFKSNVIRSEAYMLVYRKCEEESPKCCPEDIPNTISELLESDIVVQCAALEKYREMQKKVRVRVVSCLSPEEKAVGFIFDRQMTLDEVADKIIEKIPFDKNIEMMSTSYVDSCAQREVDIEWFDTSRDKKIDELRWYNSMFLYIRSRKSSPLQFKIHQWIDDKLEFSGSVVIVAQDGTMGDLKARLVEKDGWLLSKDPKTIDVYGSDGNGTLLDESIVLREIFDVEDGVCSLYAEEHVEESPILAYFDRLQHLITLHFNDPSPTPSKKGSIHSVTIDDREPLLAFREVIRKQLNWSEAQNFRIQKGSWNPLELKDDSMALKSIPLFSGSTVLLHMGTPLRVNQRRLRFFTPVERSWREFDEIICNDSAPIADIREVVAARKGVEPNFVRLREKKDEWVGHILRNCEVVGSIGLSDLIEVAVTVRDEEEDLDSSTIVISVQRIRRRPVEWEAALERKVSCLESFESLLSTFAKEMGIPLEFCSYAFLFHISLFDRTPSFEHVYWKPSDLNSSSFMKSYRLHDGDYLILRDTREEEDSGTVTKKGEDGLVISNASVVERPVYVEKQLRIYSRYTRDAE